MLIENRALKLIHYVHGLMSIKSWDGTSAEMVDLVGGRKNIIVNLYNSMTR